MSLRDEALKDLRDKRDFKNTTTRKFKEDLFDYYEELGKDKHVLELGTSHGDTTRLLSFIFESVTTIDHNHENTMRAQKRNSDRSNIHYITANIYGNKDAYVSKINKKVDVAFLDCMHTLDGIIHDIHLSTKEVGEPPMELIFDDYGHPDEHGVFNAIEYIKDKWSGLVLSEVKQIGEGEGAKCFPEGDRSNNKGLLRSEGGILKIEYEW